MSHQFSFPTFNDDMVKPVSQASPPSDHHQPTGERCASIAQFLEHNLSQYAFDTETASAARERADSTINTLISQLKSKILQLSQELESKDYDLCNTKMEISAVKRDLSIVKQDLSASNLELSATKVNLSAAKKDLEMYEGKLNGTMRELGMTKKALDIAREQATDIMDEILDCKADCNLAMEKSVILDLRLSAATEELAFAAEDLEAKTRELEDTKTALYNAVNERDHALLKISHLEGGAGQASECEHGSDTSDTSSQFFNFYLTPPELVGVRRKRRENEDDPETPTRPQKKIRILVKEAPAKDIEMDSTLMSWGEAASGQGVEEAAQSVEEEEELVEVVEEEVVKEEVGEEVWEEAGHEVKEGEMEEELEPEVKEEVEEEEEEEEEDTGEEDAEVDVDDAKDGDYETSDGEGEDEADEDQDEEKDEADQKVSRIIRIRVPLDQRTK